MIINSPNLRALFTGFKANFMEGLGQAPKDHEFFCTPVNSTTLDEEYPWLGELPGMREWVDERFLHNLKSEGYKLRNKDWEDTVTVPRNAIRDDRYGVYATPMRALGTAASSQPCELAYATLKTGDSSLCYDGQFFFDTDHPVITPNGSQATVSNYGGGAGALWVLMCTTKPIKPILFQNREDPNFVALDTA